MESKIVTITPEMATIWLENAGTNRSLRKATVDRYARDMKEGKWQLNGETIVISSAGQLLNGQHRLHACIKAGESFRTVVCEGAAADAFKTIDSGRCRTVSDMFYLMGTKYANVHAGAVALLYRYDRDILSSTMTPTNEEALATTAKYPEAGRWVETADRAHSIVSATILAFVACAGARVFDDDTSELFIEAVAEGVNLARHSPARLLRERLLAAKGYRSQKFQRITVLAFTIKAFVAFAQDESLGVLKWLKSEPMPKILKRPRRISTMNGREAVQ